MCSGIRRRFYRSRASRWQSRSAARKDRPASPRATKPQRMSSQATAGDDHPPGDQPPCGAALSLRSLPVFREQRGDDTSESLQAGCRQGGAEAHRHRRARTEGEPGRERHRRPLVAATDTSDALNRASSRRSSAIFIALAGPSQGPDRGRRQRDRLRGRRAAMGHLPGLPGLGWPSPSRCMWAAVLIRFRNPTATPRRKPTPLPHPLAPQ